jgi:hypothetical protein
MIQHSIQSGWDVFPVNCLIQSKGAADYAIRIAGRWLCVYNRHFC